MMFNNSEINIDSINLPLMRDDQTKSSWFDTRGVRQVRSFTNTPVDTPMVRNINIPSERGEFIALFSKAKSVIRNGVFNVLGFNSQRFGRGQKIAVLPAFSSPFSEGMIIRRLAEKSGVFPFGTSQNAIPSTING